MTNFNNIWTKSKFVRILKQWKEFQNVSRFWKLFNSFQNWSTDASMHKFCACFQLLHLYTFPHICLLNNWTEGKYMPLYADIENHLALRPYLLMAVGTPGRRHSFFPCNLKSNKPRLIMLVYVAYHLDYTFKLIR